MGKASVRLLYLKEILHVGNGNNDQTLNEQTQSEDPAGSEFETKESLLQALEEARRKAAENWDLFLRARADADNIQRRARLDIENAHKYGVEKFAREILSVVDSLDHGLAAADSSETQSAKSLREGMELTFKMLLSTLEKFGIHQINPVGEVFDPARHEALSTQASRDIEPNKVLIVVQKGFTLHDRLLRPARVIVSRAE